MTAASTLETDRAILSLCELAQAHPADVQRAGRSLWRQVEARIDAATQKKRAGVEWELKVLEEARSFALDPSHVVENEILRDLCWNDRVQIMKRRQRYNHDLDRVSAKRAYLDAQVRGLKKDPQAAKQLGATVREQRAVLERRLDPACQRNEVVGPCWVIAELILKEVGELKAVRTGEQWWRIAAMFVAAEGLDFPCELLGLPHELPVHESESGDSLFVSRDGIRWLATLLLPATDVEEEYEVLVQRTAIRLRALAPPVAVTELEEAKREPRQGRRTSVAPRDGWFWLVDVEDLYGVKKSTADEWTRKAKWGSDKRYLDDDHSATRLLRAAFEDLLVKKGKTWPGAKH